MLRGKEGLKLQPTACVDFSIGAKNATMLPQSFVSPRYVVLRQEPDVMDGCFASEAKSEAPLLILKGVVEAEARTQLAMHSLCWLLCRCHGSAHALAALSCPQRYVILCQEGVPDAELLIP